MDDPDALPEFLARFLHGGQDPATFAHADHVRVAYEMLRRHPFLDAARAFSGRLKLMTARIGRPEVYNETITVAFLSLISEAMQGGTCASFEAFAAEHPELMQKSVLTRWYTRERLTSDAARRTFLLPGCNGSSPPI